MIQNSPQCYVTPDPSLSNESVNTAHDFPFPARLTRLQCSKHQETPKLGTPLKSMTTFFDYSVVWSHPHYPSSWRLRLVVSPELFTASEMAIFFPVGASLLELKLFFLRSMLLVLPALPVVLAGLPTDDAEELRRFI